MTTGTNAILRGFLEILVPLHEALSSPESFSRFLYNVGYEIETLDTFFDHVEAFSELAERTQQIIDLTSSLDGDETFGMDDWPTVLAAVIAVVDSVMLIQDVASDISDIDNIVEPLNQSAFWRDLAEDIPSYLVVSYLKYEQPMIYAVARLIGVIDSQVPSEYSNGQLQVKVVWERLPDLFTDPEGVIAEAYNWDGAYDEEEGFEYTDLINNLGLIGRALGTSLQYRDISLKLQEQLFEGKNVPRDAYALTLPFFSGTVSSGGAFAEIGLQIVPLANEELSTDTIAVMGGFAIIPYVIGEAEVSTPLNENETMLFNAEVAGDFNGAVRLDALPSGMEWFSDAGNIVSGSSAQIEIVFKGASDTGNITLIGKEDGTNISIDNCAVGVGIEDGDFYLSAGVTNFNISVDVSEDGLLSHIVPGSIEASAGDILAGWRQNQGFYLEQSGSLSIYVPLDIELGPVRLHEMGLSFSFVGEKRLTSWVSGDVTIGPLFLGLEEVGLHADFVSSETGGKMGAFNIDLSPKYPTGYVVALDGGVISGGGALIKEDYDYKGALSLQFQNFGLSAYGILSTKMPDGEDGFSFLASIFGEFSVALGYGFFLTGLGGIVGINRTTNIEELRSVLFEGRLDSILFPNEPITDATVILNDLANCFPVAEGQHLFGPMGRIGWGVPTLIEGKIGVIIEMGASVRLLVLGSVGVALPTKETSVVALYVDFVGYIDFDTGEISFDAAITNSHILNWPISGEAAVRTGWGDNAGLVAAMGGLHPQYPNPAGFPSLERLTIALGQDNPQLTLTAYQAVTTNSVQMGAEARLYVNAGNILFVGEVEVEGWAGFNALIIFNPFSFDVALSLGLQLLVDQEVICGIGGDLRLQGPNRFTISGKVWVTVFGIDVKIPIENKWGNAKTDKLETVALLDVLSHALSERQDIELVHVTNRSTGVAFSGDSVSSILDPTHGLRITQNAVPLDTTIEKVGNAELSGAIRKVSLDAVLDNGDNVTLGDASNEFVRSHYYTSTDDEKLSEPVFEKFRSGVELSDQAGFAVDDQTVEALSGDYEYVWLENDQADVISGARSAILSDMLERSYQSGIARELDASHKNIVNKFARGLDNASLIPNHIEHDDATLSSARMPTADYINNSIFKKVGS